MILGLDTSIVLRLLTGTPEKQAKLALETLEESIQVGKKIMISDLVIAESYYGLCCHYDVPMEEAIKQLLNFLQSGMVTLEPNGQAIQSLKETKSKKVGFVDRMIRHQYLKNVKEVMTFDKNFSSLTHVKLLKG